MAELNRLLLLLVHFAIVLFFLRVLFRFHALLGLLKEPRLSSDLLATAAEAMELIEKSIFAVVVQPLLFVPLLLLFLRPFLFLLSILLLLSGMFGLLSAISSLLLLFLFLINLDLRLQLALCDGLAKLLEGLVCVLEAILRAFNRLFLERYLLVLLLLMLIYNIVYVFLWCLLLRFWCILRL